MKLSSKLITILVILSFFFIQYSVFAVDKETTGFASWYGTKFHGKKTASGEIYDKNKLTAAHKTLPFGTKLKVTYLKTNKSVIVRVNDRGPFIKGRILDISEAAAKKVGLVNDGVGKIKVVILSKGANFKTDASKTDIKAHDDSKTTTKPKVENPFKEKQKPVSTSVKKTNKEKVNLNLNIDSSITFKIQFGAFQNVDYAKDFRDKLRNKGLKVSVFKAYVGEKIIYKVLSTENFNDPNLGKKIVDRLKEKGFKGFLLKVKM